MSRAFKINKQNSKRWLLCLLLPALLFTQWLGLAHKISHAGWAGNSANAGVVVAQAASQTAQAGSFLFGSQDENALHSCALYDAVSAADFLHQVQDVQQLQAGKALVTPSTAILSWLAALQVPFSSRAPPSLFA
ncbi:hypothetical protein ACO0LC_16225 [Undibacterium sp. JH2W]|uniref:hypothetical protein n=1 Tax=Undibacterium sp. JH2W TaxID=3413037 RepID=UPI003BEFA240